MLISSERIKRPSEFEKASGSNLLNKSEPSSCPFCPGNEEKTPPADLVLVSKQDTLLKLADSENERIKDWTVRYFPNKYPAVSLESEVKYTDSPLQSEPGFGYHHVMVLTPKHSDTFFNLPVEQWTDILATLQDRIRWLYSRKAVGYVSVFVNNGFEAGASFAHPHLQTITLTKLPPVIEEEAQAVHSSMIELSVCPMCKVLNVESNGERKVLSTENFTAFCPWAPTSAFEFWIFPKKHETSFLKVSQKEIRDLAMILRATMGALGSVLNDPSFNLVFHISSEKKTTKQIHWHIEVYPQVTKWAGLEKGSGVYINPFPPEQAALLLGAAARKELAEIIGIS